MRDRIGDFVNEELELELSDKKTRIAHATEGIDFLGYHIELNDENGVERTIPEEAKEDLLGKVEEATAGETQVSVRRKINALNAVLRGWANYYKYATDAGTVFNELDYYVWRELADWLAQKYDCSQKELANRKLESVDPLRIEGITLYRMEGNSEIYDESHTGKDHPYLSDTEIIRDEFPEEDPDLANTEDREGWMDARRETLERDGWSCQECGKDLKQREAHVHHKRPYSSYGSHKEANKVENLESLCPNCHKDIEVKRLCH